MTVQPFRRATATWCLALVCTAATSVEAAAQDALGVLRRQATRSELEQAAQAAGSASIAATDPKMKAKLESQSIAVRNRLRTGDFSPGDRILLSVTYADTAILDTVIVRIDQKVRLANMPDVSLQGVLDSELNAHLKTILSKYLKDPSVIATGLVRLAVTGSVGKPGFLTAPVDQLVTDVLMAAGGPTQTARLDAVYVRRDGETFLNAKQVSEAIRSGKTVGDVSLRDGDEIFVPVSNPVSGNALTKWTAVVSAATGLFFLLRFGGGGRGRTL